MAIRRGKRGVKRHRPMSGLQHLGTRVATGQSSRFIAWYLQNDAPSTQGDSEPVTDPATFAWEGSFIWVVQTNND